MAIRFGDTMNIQNFWEIVKICLAAGLHGFVLLFLAKKSMETEEELAEKKRNKDIYIKVPRDKPKEEQ